MQGTFGIRIRFYETFIALKIPKINVKSAKIQLKWTFWIINSVVSSNFCVKTEQHFTLTEQLIWRSQRLTAILGSKENYADAFESCTYVDIKSQNLTTLRPNARGRFTMQDDTTTINPENLTTNDMLKADARINDPLFIYQKEKREKQMAECFSVLR